MYITSRDFRANQTKFVGKAMQGEDIILTTRAGKVKLVPYEDNVITPELQAQIDEARREMLEGKCITFRSHEEIDNYFDSI